MRSRGHLPRTRSRLFVEFLEDRTNPAGFVDPFAGPALSVVDAPSDRVNVITDDGAESPAVLEQLASAPFAAEVHHVGFGIYNVTLTAGVELTEAITFYSSLPGVTAAEPDYTLQARLTPNDTQYSQLYAMPRISAPAAWDVNTGSGDFVVAIIDTGVDYNHPDLAANIWHNPAEVNGDGIDNDGNGLVDDYYGAEFVGTNSGNPFDDNGHGTHVAGTIGAIGNNALGVVGVNWHVKIMALKFLSASGSGSTSDAVEALNYAVAHGVKVSNNSWGGGGFSQALFNAIQAAQNAGHIFVAAAGNSNVNIDNTPSYPASYNLANVVAVASTTSTDARSSFSNYGVNTVDIAAPGSSILSTTPNNTYSIFSGTSMATPHVVGAIALYWDANPTATATQVINALTSSADTVAGLTSVVAGGRRLNVGRLLQSVSPPVPPVPPPPPPLDTTGARVTAAVFSGTSTANFTKVRFTFNEAIAPGSFTAADIVSFTGPGGAIDPSGFTVAAVNAPTNTQFDVTFSSPQTTAGTYTIVIGPDILDVASNPLDQNADGVNGSVPGDQFTAAQALIPVSTQTFSWSGSLPIRDLQTTTATITINQDISIADLNARFSLNHTWDSDLRVRLIGPGGQIATLVNRRGGSANNFTNTTLDDEASTAIGSGAAPFNGTYRPESTLTVFDGTNARGTWRLEVTDLARQDTGTLLNFSLIITGGSGGLSVSALGFREGEPFTEPVAPVTSSIETIDPAALEEVLPTEETVEVTSPVNLLLDAVEDEFTFAPTEYTAPVVRSVILPEPETDAPTGRTTATPSDAPTTDEPAAAPELGFAVWLGL